MEVTKEKENKKMKTQENIFNGIEKIEKVRLAVFYLTI